MLFQYGCSLLVADDCAFEFAEVGGAGCRKLHLFDDQFALVVEPIAFSSDGGVIAGEIEIEIDGIGGFVDDITGRERDIETVAPTAGCTQIDGDRAGLVVEWNDVGADHPGADEQ